MIQKSYRILLSIITLIFCTTIFADLAHAIDQRPVLLVSDIDDTIKVSEVIKPGVIVRLGNFNNPFAGMASLYQLFVNENISNTKVFYLSNAPSEVLGLEPMRVSHQALLDSNRFPKGELILRQSILDDSHKINTIRALVKKYNPSLVMMVGDNGEKDVFIYAQATAELQKQNIKTLTYIHQLYSKDIQLPLGQGKAIQSGQVGFATPIEIGIDLVQKKYLAQKSLDWMFAHTAKYIMVDSILDAIDFTSSVSFPYFKNCSDFKWQATWPVNDQTREYKIFLEDKCR